MPVDQERGSWGEAGGHGLGVAGIQLHQDEALPGGAVALSLGLDPLKEGLLKFEDLLDVHAGDMGLGGSSGAVGEDDIFEVVGAGRKDRGAFVDLSGIKEVEDGEVLDVEDFVHALDGEATLAVEEVGDVGLFESGLLGEAESGELARLNSLPEDFSEIVLQDPELH